MSIPDRQPQQTLEEAILNERDPEYALGKEGQLPSMQNL
jgi:hypothetical protein